MPLSKVKQSEYMRNRRRSLGITQTIPVRYNVIPKLAEAGLILQGNRILGLTKIVQPDPLPGIPIYNPLIHSAGDTVLLKQPYSKRYVKTVIPEVDADGNAIPDF